MNENIDDIIDVEEELMEPPVPSELEIDFDMQKRYFQEVTPQTIKISKDMERLNKRITLK